MRSQLFRVIRDFFYKNDFVEVETPVRVEAPALEEYIDAEPSGDWFLRTSPELHMKRLVQAGLNRIFQIGPCFRHGEYGKRHRPEFTMLEWYAANADYRGILVQTQNLIREIFKKIHKGTCFAYMDYAIDVYAPWNELSVKHAFTQYGKTSLESALANNTFDQILVGDIEPNLGTKEPTILIDYPIALGGLARQNPSDPKLAERWELYIAGIELANAYSELTDADEQNRRFEECARSRRQRNHAVYPIDEDFLLALKNGLPACAGCALGIDRLLMILAKCSNLEDVLFF